MANWLQLLAGTLAGAGQGYLHGQMQKQQRDDEQQKLDEERAWREKQFEALQEQNAFNRAATTWQMRGPDEDISADPMLAEYKRFGFGTRTIAPKAAPKIADTFTLPSGPSYGLSAAPQNGQSEPPPSAPPLDDAPPITINAPTFGMGTPGKVTRTPTRQESLQDVAVAKLTEELNNPNTPASVRFAIRQALADMGGIRLPNPQALREGPISGGKQTLYDPIDGSPQATLDATPSAPAPDFDFVTAFEIANGKPFDATTATPEEKKKATEEQARQRRAGQVSSSGPRVDQGGFSDRDRVDYQQALSKLFARPEVRDYQEVSRYIGPLDAAMAEARKGNPDSLIAVDQALINSFNKMLDPTSVVREAEYARTASDQSLVNRLRGQLGPDGKLVLGGAGLTLQDREAMARMAKAFVSAAEKKSTAAMQEIADYYDAIVTANGKSIGERLRESWQRTGARQTATNAPSEEATPPQVLAAGPGEHTFANGQTWVVAADGKTARRIR